MKKKLIFPLILAGSLLASCGDSASSDLMERTEGLLIETQGDNSSTVQEFKDLMNKAESGDADSVENLITAMYSLGILTSDLNYSAEMAKWQIYADWLALGVERESDVCAVALGLLSSEQNKAKKRAGDIRNQSDYALSKISLAGDNTEIESQAKEAYKRLRAIPEQNRTKLERAIIHGYQDSKER